MIRNDYVAGVAGEIDGVATLWKNGAAQTLSTQYSIAYSVYVSGSDVYVAGFEDPDGAYGSGDNKRATLWKNGVAQTLSEQKSTTRSVYVSGSDVYVAGGVKDDRYDNLLKTALWKNGVAQTFDRTSTEVANSVYVSGTDVYVTDGDAARYWKNGIRQTLNTNGSGTNQIKALSIFVVPNN